MLSQRLHITLGIDGRRNHLLNVKNEATLAHTRLILAYVPGSYWLILHDTKDTGSWLILRILAHTKVGYWSHVHTKATGSY